MVASISQTVNNLALLLRSNAMRGSKRKHPHYTEAERLDAVELHAAGYTQMEIAATTGMAQSTVSELLKKARTERTVQDLPKPGAPHKIQGKALQYIVSGALRGKFNSAADICQYLLHEKGIDVSDDCVLETLRREGIDSKRLAWLREPTDNQRVRRVAFARQLFCCLCSVRGS